MLVSQAEVAIALFSAALGGMAGAVGGAYGATQSLKKELQDMRTEYGDRLIRAETRIGITEDGSLTGNGVIGTLRSVVKRMDQRNDRQHPYTGDGHHG